MHAINNGCSNFQENCNGLWHVKRCNIVCGNKCVVYRNIYGLKHIFVDTKKYLCAKKNICGQKNIFVDIKYICGHKNIFVY